jgi:hypothetical protein
MIEVDRAMIEDFRIELIQMMEHAGRNLRSSATPGVPDVCSPSNPAPSRRRPGRWHGNQDATLFQPQEISHRAL